MIRIPCTVAILTHNSASTLTRALESVRSFDDVLICDGGSTDDTRQIAASFGARILEQDPSYHTKEGRIRDFGGVRNQTLDAARYPWFLFLDSDEYLSDALVQEVREIIEVNRPAAYWVPRLYVVKGNVIHCASTYPNKQMRFFHRGSVRRFIKEVHERIELLENAPVRHLAGELFVPITESPAELREKWRTYLAIEEQRQSSRTFRSWAVASLRDAAIGTLFFARMIRNILCCRKGRMPLALELTRLWYQKELILVSWRAVTRL